MVIKYDNPQHGTTITCELIIFDTHDNLYLQIGMKKNSHNKLYYPETFIINSAGPLNPNPRVNGNPVYNVVKRSRLNRDGYNQRVFPNTFRKRGLGTIRNTIRRRHH